MTTRTHRNAAALLAGAALLLAGCSSTATTGTATTSSRPDRTNSQAVANSFATAWAGGDLNTACSYTMGDAKKKLTEKGQCQGTATWRQFPSSNGVCSPAPDGSISYPFLLNGTADGFDSFVVTTARQADGLWGVEYLIEGDRGEASMSCTYGYAGSSASILPGTTG